MYSNRIELGRRGLWAALTTVVLAWPGGAQAQTKTFTYSVSLPTDALKTNSASGPFSLDFQFTDGSGTAGDGNNTVELSGFSTGSSGPATLTDTTSFAEVTDPFTPPASPGGELTFLLQTTNNTDAGSTASPDEFAFFVLDSTNHSVPTTDAAGGSLFTVDLGGDSPTITVYQGTGSYQGLVPTLSPAPEPSSVATLGLGAVGLAALGRRARRRVA